jgi:hypothetical protein
MECACGQDVVHDGRAVLNVETTGGKVTAVPGKRRVRLVRMLGMWAVIVVWVALSALWVRSYWYYERLELPVQQPKDGFNKYSRTLASQHGTLCFYSFHSSANGPRALTSPFMTKLPAVTALRLVTTRADEVGPDVEDPSYGGSSAGLLGFAKFKTTMIRSYPMGETATTEIEKYTVPFWAVHTLS